MTGELVQSDPSDCKTTEEAHSEEEILLAILQLARDIDDLVQRADALGLGMPGLKLHEAAELCRREAPEPGTR
jgi:hypothetical protein